jgi:hypothetical protein
MRQRRRYPYTGFFLAARDPQAMLSARVDKDIDLPVCKVEGTARDPVLRCVEINQRSTRDSLWKVTRHIAVNDCRKFESLVHAKPLPLEQNLVSSQARIASHRECCSKRQAFPHPSPSEFRLPAAERSTIRAMPCPHGPRRARRPSRDRHVRARRVRTARRAACRCRRVRVCGRDTPCAVADAS